MKKLILVSSCLAGVKCRYDGKDNKVEKIAQLVENGKAIAVCPEVFSGMPIPRKPCEIITTPQGERKIITAEKTDFTEEFKNGAEKCLEIAKILEIETAILKQRSPSCGKGKIYDGTFSGKIISGNGFTTNLLEENNIKVYTEEDFKKVLDF